MSDIAERLGIDCSDILEADEEMPVEEFVRMTLEEIAELPGRASEERPEATQPHLVVGPNPQRKGMP